MWNRCLNLVIARALLILLFNHAFVTWKWKITRLTEWSKTHIEVKAVSCVVDGWSSINILPSVNKNKTGNSSTTPILVLDNLDVRNTLLPTERSTIDCEDNDNNFEHQPLNNIVGLDENEEMDDSKCALKSDTVTDRDTDRDKDHLCSRTSNAKIAVTKTNLEHCRIKRLCVDGILFSASDCGHHSALLIVLFDNQCTPIEVFNWCEKHTSETTNEDCPWSCVVEIHKQMFKRVSDWPGRESDYHHLCPAAHQEAKRLKCYLSMERDSKGLCLHVPPMEAH